MTAMERLVQLAANCPNLARNLSLLPASYLQILFTEKEPTK